ncbi:MAG: sigma-E factor negative regulatory protein, partial [Methylococcales bacterium]
MQEDLDIKISMLLDGELASGEALKVFNRIRNESALRAKWMRYNIASFAFKEKSAMFTDAGFFDRVSRALEHEAPIVGPNPGARKKLLPNPAYSMALAASVALVAVIVWSGIPSSTGTPDNRSNRSGLVATQGEAPAPVLPVKLEPAERPALPKRFNDYLITHNESTYTTGAQTMMP